LLQEIFEIQDVNSVDLGAF